MKPYPPRGSDFYDSSVEVQRPIFGIDIDGTLVKYHEHFIRFAEGWLGRDLPPVEGYGGGPFYRYLGISKSTYRKIKLAYRRGGLKRSLPAFPGAGDLTRSLRQRGAIIVLATTRPYLSLENIDEDTRVCCKRNSIPHDHIIWGEDKYRTLSRFGDRVVGVLEDEPALLRQARSVGLYAVRIRTTYNVGAECDSSAETLADAKELLHAELNIWERKHRA